jgi:hypothetical protein
MATRNIVALSLFVAAISLKLPQAIETRSLETLLPDLPFSELSDSESDTVPPSTLPNSPNSVSSPPADQVETQSNLLRIHTCNGEVSRANFREFPTLNPSAILGEIKWGDSVRLKGRVIQAEGMMWHEAIAQNQLEPGQTGWIAGCFVNNN